MTRNRNLKRLVRARAAKTGESYTAALRHIRQTNPAPRMRRGPTLFRVAARSWLRQELIVSTATEDMVLTASWRPGFPTAIWSVRQGNRILATLRNKALAPLRTCIVQMGGETFRLRKRLAFSRLTQVEGGRFDGATLSGNFSDLNSRLEHHGRLLATAQARPWSVHDTHVVRILADEDPAAIELAAVMMIDLLIQKQAEG